MLATGLLSRQPKNIGTPRPPSQVSIDDNCRNADSFEDFIRVVGKKNLLDKKKQSMPKPILQMIVTWIRFKKQAFYMSNGQMLDVSRKALKLPKIGTPLTLLS